MTVIDRVIKKAGTQVKLAKLLGVTQAAVSYWKLGGKISAEKALLIQKEFGIPLKKLLPDLKL